MVCPKCSLVKNSHFDKLSIRLRNHCVDCQKKWEARPENDPANGKYIIHYSYSVRDWQEVYAKSEQEARDQIIEEGDDFTIDDVTCEREPKEEQ
jgi:hypothetical protein